MDIPETRYARSGDVSIAYQVLGDGPFDLVHIPPLASHVELSWQVPGIAHASFQQKNYLLAYHILHEFFAQPEPVYRGE